MLLFFLISDITSVISNWVLSISFVNTYKEIMFQRWSISKWAREANIKERHIKIIEVPVYEKWSGRKITAIRYPKIKITQMIVKAIIIFVILHFLTHHQSRARAIQWNVIQRHKIDTPIWGYKLSLDINTAPHIMYRRNGMLNINTMITVPTTSVHTVFPIHNAQTLYIHSDFPHKRER